MSARRRRTAWLLAATWMVALAGLSLTPLAGPPPAPDYVEHAAAYLVLAWFLRRAMTGGGASSRRGALVPVLIAIGYGVLLEGLQAALPYRTAELHDILANAGGAALSMILPVARARAPATREDAV